MITYLALPIIFLVGYFIIKKYNTQAVLLLAGLLMIMLGVMNGDTDFMPKGGKPTGSIIVDFFEVIHLIASSTLAKLGLIIMAVGGFSKYMSHIGAANAMVQIATKPLSYIKNPYLVLAMAYITGQLINIFIPSATGLSLLLLVAMYPVLVGVGCNPAAAAAVVATTGCLDLGPASSAANKAAEVSGIDVATYFVSYQLQVSIAAMVVIASLHFVCQRYFDRKDAENGVQSEFNIQEKEQRVVPKWFAIFPVLPLGLLLTFSPFGIDTIKMNVVTAMFIALFISMVFDYVLTRDGKTVAASLRVYLDGMGGVFASVVSLIIAAQVFVTGLETIGFISLLLDSASSLGFGYIAMVLVLVSIIVLVTLLSGSGNASFFSFSNLAPDVAAQVGAPIAAVAMPMQLASGLMRSASPVAGVIIACAAVANVSPIDLAKRTVIPMLGGLVTVLLASQLFI
ncbi:C4-dicarboxylate ABC transporter [Vibrio tarriae]|uniref:C4-dicarboxylate transporter DcuC n=1 Tax=Vibrio tarriae TaxID=2014742 RepID=UPI000DE40CA3|nr:C4-dicarboxylate transporter DcuC [Vibrio tarriae]QEO45792.1 C4-dicarboxylate ABC transporter [Vibrio cholerae]RBM27198.1 C4-dicarboxylate ABC transporter [Vibrio tarriae]RBM31137.1 C4-dicarboxylate ABC transporter [Vibrio tarriae]RBM32530.1 C4-dicarboxylate ABC transporter [Vibrio tarriae]RBM37767.1 C4-dicarboxylate ABC transporter [Vibrio tarriae]